MQIFIVFLNWVHDHIWIDPVWSKVISAGIIALIAWRFRNYIKVLLIRIKRFIKSLKRNKSAEYSDGGQHDKSIKTINKNKKIATISMIITIVAAIVTITGINGKDIWQYLQGCNKEDKITYHQNGGKGAENSKYTKCSDTIFLRMDSNKSAQNTSTSKKVIEVEHPNILSVQIKILHRYVKEYGTKLLIDGKVLHYEKRADYSDMPYDEPEYFIAKVKEGQHIFSIDGHCETPVTINYENKEIEIECYNNKK